MNRDQLTGKIGELVDVLRTGEARRISMADIASITEVLITTMERYFSSIDASIYREFQELSDHITAMRTEIARAQPKEISADRIPRAGKELDEVVRATEDATNAIMEAAEEIMSADPSDLAAYQESVNESCMKIFEACSFRTSPASGSPRSSPRWRSLRTVWAPS
jgi:chemotaxis protein CheZ